MGRRAHTKEQKNAKKRERNRKYLANPEALARKRAADRLRKREIRRQRACLTVPDSLALLADTAIQLHMLQQIKDIKEGDSLPHFNCEGSAPERADRGNGGYDHKGQVVTGGDHIDGTKNGGLIKYDDFTDSDDTPSYTVTDLKVKDMSSVT